MFYWFVNPNKKALGLIHWAGRQWTLSNYTLTLSDHRKSSCPTPHGHLCPWECQCVFGGCLIIYCTRHVCISDPTTWWLSSLCSVLIHSLLGPFALKYTRNCDSHRHFNMTLESPLVCWPSQMSGAILILICYNSCCLQDILQHFAEIQTPLQIQFSILHLLSWHCIYFLLSTFRSIKPDLLVSLE